ncbi:MAG: CBS domain-containing protein [Gammaproteobacteria bacterium]
MGDALAIALLEARGFTESDFAKSHPGGTLGRRLLLHIADIMHSGDGIPSVGADASLRDGLMEMTNKGLGMTVVVAADNTVVGIFTDGDLRRTLDQGVDVHDCGISEVMTSPCKVAHADMLAAEALQIMQEKKINAIPIVDQRQHLIGAISMHDLLRAGVV